MPSHNHGGEAKISDGIPKYNFGLQNHHFPTTLQKQKEPYPSWAGSIWQRVYCIELNP
jgi:hypothetical protein